MKYYPPPPKKKFSKYIQSANWPVTADGGNGLEAAGCQLVGSSEAAIHSPVEQIDLVWIQF